MARFNATEQIGVNAVQRIVLRELEWIFREQPVIDMGIDAQIELVLGQAANRQADRRPDQDRPKPLHRDSRGIRLPRESHAPRLLDEPFAAGRPHCPSHRLG
ncbi:DUF4365 domain-containing protein [Cupriavidus campinensis]|uniref:DUF4365 domain-containing protein n=1 Tax=Cupriavidus campinensis TaxID=151783 RepID=A0ABY3EI77_9BURK|nr:DUF4365 domain-containing protein [Cupriavidus campinensis]